MRIQRWGLALAVLATGVLSGACADGGGGFGWAGSGSGCDFSDQANPTWEEFRDERLAGIDAMLAALPPEYDEGAVPGDTTFKGMLEELRAEVSTDPYEQILAAAPADAKARLMGFLCENPEFGRFGTLTDGTSKYLTPVVTFDAALEICMGKEGLTDENGEPLIRAEVVSAAKRFVCPAAGQS